MANGWQMASKWLEDGWKIALSVKLSSSPYPIHHQPVTPFLEDMADFFTYKLYIMLTIGGGCVKTHEWHAPKGQKHIAQGSALGKRNPHATYAL